MRASFSSLPSLPDDDDDDDDSQWVALPFYAQFGAVMGVAGVFRVPAMGWAFDNKGNASSLTESTSDYTALIYSAYILRRNIRSFWFRLHVAS